ncbi:YacL family protein, partial [Serratia sp. CY74664]|uniref:YacL family protein n=1 Tax=Serratia sp. CY74664 TaxID=3383676 RepID=UPI003FA00C7E
MDYEFLRDVTGQVIVRFSMGHEAIGHWINEEVKGDFNLLDRIEAGAAEVKGSERQWQLEGHEYTLLMDGEEVMIRANQLEFEGDEMEEGIQKVMPQITAASRSKISPNRCSQNGASIGI